MHFDVKHEKTIIKILLNIRMRLNANVVAWNVASMSIQLSFVPILVLLSIHDL